MTDGRRRQFQRAEREPFVLRVPRTEDVILYHQFLQNPAVTIWLEDECQTPLSYQHIENFVMAPVWYRRAIEYKGEFIGLTGLEEPDLTLGTARFFFVIGDPTLWGKGIGEGVLRAVVAEAFNTLGLCKITSSYLSPNIASRIIHERVGFQEDGCLHQKAFRNGAWVDQVLLTLFRQT